MAGVGQAHLSLELSLSALDDRDYEGHIGSSGLAVRFAGPPFEHQGKILQPMKVFAFDRDITMLLAELSGLPHESGRVIVMIGGDQWGSMCTLAMATQAAHYDAAWNLEDVEALRALDVPDIGERVAYLERLLVGDAVGKRLRGGPIAARSIRRRL